MEQIYSPKEFKCTEVTDFKSYFENYDRETGSSNDFGTLGDENQGDNLSVIGNLMRCDLSHGELMKLSQICRLVLNSFILSITCVILILIIIILKG